MIALVTGQQVAFWILAPLAIALALGMAFSRKPVHSALSLAGMMVCLGCLYATLDAPFLFVAQIIVYTGAVMMLFVFTMMVIGIDSLDSLVETLRAQRLLAFLGAFGFLIMVGSALVNGIAQTNPDGLTTANAEHGGNVQGLAQLVFTDYVFAFEATGALLITAALAAMVLTHGERLTKPERQKQRADRKIREFETEGKHPGSRPGPGSFARHNAIQYPALGPDGKVVEKSVSPTLKVRGAAILDAEGLSTAHLAAAREIASSWDELDGTDNADKYDDPDLGKATELPAIESESSEEEQR